ncbi:hypothetical protein R1sor_002644 [Riccia sorocarpa]|uniref:Uncharacterized protein n=1 Tax=Riccia sorocarpa TaxID=122646 RepID=A0ABD3H2H7_9MARC
MNAPGGDLASLLKPFHERAALAEDRLARLEAQLQCGGGPKAESKSAVTLEDLTELRNKLELVKSEQLAERKKAQEELAASAAEIRKLAYQLIHLKRSLVEADNKILELQQGK